MNPHEIFELLLPSPRHPLGAVVPSQNPATSKIEQKVRHRLLAAGLAVEQGWAIQCGLDPFSGKFPVLTPDFILKDTTICVEVDPLYTHGRRVLHDVVRNALFTQVGWTVIRLRLGGQPPLGGYDVVTGSESITEAVITALVAAVTDAITGQKAQVRQVRTTTAAATPASPVTPAARAQPILTPSGAAVSAPPSRLGALTTRPRFDNAVFFTWQLDYGDKLNLALLDSGRYLGKNTAKGGVRFIRTTHFHTIPQQQWPAALEAALEPLAEAELAPVSPFPWGERFFTGPCGEQVLVPSTFNLGGGEMIIDTELPAADSWTPTSVSAGDTALIELHPAAADTGWLIAEVQHRPTLGPHRYKIRMTRTGQRTGHWA